MKNIANTQSIKQIDPKEEAFRQKSSDLVMQKLVNLRSYMDNLEKKLNTAEQNEDLADAE